MEKIKKIIDTIRIIAELIGIIKDFIEENNDRIEVIIHIIKEIWTQKDEIEIPKFKSTNSTIHYKKN